MSVTNFETQTEFFEHLGSLKGTGVISYSVGRRTVKNLEEYLTGLSLAHRDIEFGAVVDGEQLFISARRRNQ